MSTKKHCRQTNEWGVEHDFQSHSLRDDGRGRVEQHVSRDARANQATDDGAVASQGQAEADQRNLQQEKENQNGERNVPTMGDKKCLKRSEHSLAKCVAYIKRSAPLWSRVNCGDAPSAK